MNEALADQIISMAEQDQRARHHLLALENDPNITEEEKEKAKSAIHAIDASNQVKAKELFAIHGYPGIDEVGKKASHHFWVIVQHCDTNVPLQKEVLLQLKQAVDSGNANPIDYAYLLDRVKVNENELQVFGTQIELSDDKTSFRVQAMIEPGAVNERRQLIGLDGLESYIESTNALYHSSLKSP